MLISCSAGYGEWSIPTRAYGDAWRRDRRVLHSEMREGAVEKYQGILARHTHTFLKELVEDPDNFVSISRGQALDASAPVGDAYDALYTGI